MSVSIDLPAPELAILRQLTRSTDDAEAVVRATREFIRMGRLRELKSVSGKIELNGEWQKLEELELAEIDFPN